MNSMFCKNCKTKKLRREFPCDNITEGCEHAPLHCLRCVTEYVEKFQKCSQCSESVTVQSPRYVECAATLERLFPTSPVQTSFESTVPTSENGDQTISVVMLGGECTVVAYNPHMTIQKLKNVLTTRLGAPPQKQRLLYKEKELKTDAGLTLATLQDYGVQPFSTLHLIVILYEISESLDHVIFDLFWGYPTSGVDYLDASVLLYNGSYFQHVLDYRHQCFTGVSHSGDVMDNSNRLGHHTIDVKLKSLPQGIDKLFFTLSAWNSPNISRYRNPTLRFFDAREPNKQLCSDQMQHAAYSQAIIMCSLSKIDGAWKVFSLRTLSAGNAKKYAPLKQTINGIISRGLC